MSTLIACGINHKTAPINIREQVAFTPALLPGALDTLVEQSEVHEAVILSTCNRTEVYGHIDRIGCLANWLAEHQQLSTDTLNKHLYRYQDEQAVKHLFRVAAGVDSMIIGEPEIFGQVKAAYAVAEQQGTVGKQLQPLFQSAFAFTKQVRNHSGIGRCPVSLAFAATKLAATVVNDLSQACVLLIGAGDTIELVATHLINQGVRRLVVANRSLDKAQKLAQKFYGHAITLTDIPIYLPETNMVISATASKQFLLNKADIIRARAFSKPRPLLLVDLAMPRDINPDVTECDDVYLHNIDDLKNIVADNLASRADAACHAEAFIDVQTQLFMRELRARNAVDTICDVRAQLHTICQQELQRAQTAIDNGRNAHDMLADFSQRLMNKFLHQPSHQLRCAANDNRLELLALARRLFGL